MSSLSFVVQVVFGDEVPGCWVEAKTEEGSEHQIRQSFTAEQVKYHDIECHLDGRVEHL